ncbi:Aste57867_12299 [Aphanomyces stellatus]|uniref:Aste57867_12299 protein n=1 Tax=Aphanomyces stellatus TaxID=120398 RepID=A0A485KVM1_9STRA|nr:hypothetical protein As57867_012253 [Aphanomyces stellatus]VFT89152.1 Aste57867_12299 [Aphanomyces stellatus]
MASTTPASIFLNQDLLQHICDFQDGVYADLLPLLPTGSFNDKACRQFQATVRPNHAFLIDFDTEFAPWLAAHPRLRDALRLLHCRPHLKPVFIAHAASYGQLALLEHFASELHAHNLLLDMAAWHGQVEVVDLLVKRVGINTCTTDAMDGAARNGHLNVVRFLHAHTNATCTTDAMDTAAMHGHLETVQFLQQEHHGRCTQWALDEAAANGHMEVVRFLHEHRKEGCTTRAMDMAAMNGHLDVVQFLHVNRTEGCTINAMNNAASTGRLEVVRFLHDNRTEGCTTFAMNYAASNGHLEVVRFLHENRTEGCTSVALDDAKRNGHKAVARFLLLQRSEPSFSKWMAMAEDMCQKCVAFASKGLAIA